MMPRASFLVSTLRSQWQVVAAFSLGIATVLLAFALLWHNKSADADAEFRNAVEGRIRTMQVALARYEDIVSALRIYLSGSGGFPRPVKFADLASGLLRQYDGVQALVYAPRVTATSRSAFETHARESGISNFRITERSNGHWIWARDRDEYFPVYGHKQIRGDIDVVGYDLGSDLQRRRALDRARDTAQTAATSAIQLLLPAEPGERGVLILSPIYVEGTPTNTVEQRRDGLVGFAIGIFRVSKMLETIFDRTTVPLGLDQYFFDAATPETDRLVHVHQSRMRAPGDLPPTYDSSAARGGITSTVMVADRQWTVVSVPIPGRFSHAPPLEAWGVLLAGIATTTLGILYVRAVRDRTENFQSLTRNLTNTTETLRNEVQERIRTEQELQVKTKRLERFQHLTVDRELQMIQLKDEVNGLLAELGRPKKHRIANHEKEKIQ